MPLPAPNLDDRHFQDIVDEARRLIPQYCPEWTDHNLSDPGITLVELFAWMTETTLYRLNQVPDRNYVKFLDLMGVKLEEPRPARADVSFRLAAAQPNEVTIRAGTEVATVRTETQEAISFSTDRDLVIQVATLRYVLVSPDGQTFFDVRSAFGRGLEVPIFGEPPQEGNAIYIGLAEPLAGQTLAVSMECRIEGVGVDPRDPPLVWQTFSEDEGDWVTVDVESDTTGGFNRDGTIVLHLLYDATRSVVDGREASWVRCVLVRSHEDQTTYTASPQTRDLATEIIGGTVPASQGIALHNIVLGRSDGAPNQSFRLRNYPLLPRRVGETVEVEQTDGSFEAWEERPDFSESGKYERHFVCDSATGEVRFGPAIRDASGGTRQCGAVPEPGMRVRFSSYRIGGGARGNVGRNTLTVLKSSIPYVAAVRNRYGAQGGRDGETLDQAKLRAPRVLRSRTAAITAADYEACALAASDLIARAHCLAVGDEGGGAEGSVTLLIVPHVRASGVAIRDEELVLPRRLEETVRDYVEERRPLTVEVGIRAPDYVRVGMVVTVQAQPGIDTDKVSHAVESAFIEYVHPVSGGPDGTGWPWGRALYASELMGVLQRLPEVDYVTDVRLRRFDLGAGAYAAPELSIAPPPAGLLTAGACGVTVTH